MPKRIGYAYWGFAADVRMRNGLPFSSPDGSLCHAFTIIHAFQERGWDVYRLFPDRDEEYVQDNGVHAFRAFSQEKRWNAYSRAIQTTHTFHEHDLQCHWPDLDFVLLEWRMPTIRNQLSFNDPSFDPDLLLQHALLEHYGSNGTPIICLDLDYAMNPVKDDQQFHHVFELGWKRGEKHHLDIPFYMSDMLQFPMESPDDKIVYVGNRYDRDQSFDQFFGKGQNDLQYEVWGNWLEGGKDSRIRWPHIQFMGRAQPYQIRVAYQHALATPLISRPEYNTYGFMSIRLLETLLFGTLPLLPIEFQSPVHYVPDAFRVYDETDMCTIAKLFRSQAVRTYTRAQMIHALEMHDVSHFIKKILDVL